MFQDFALTVSGGEGLLRLLDSVPKKEGKQAIRRGTKSGAQTLLPLAKSLAPVKTGVMRDTLNVKSFSKKGFIGAKVEPGTRAQMQRAQAKNLRGLLKALGVKATAKETKEAVKGTLTDKWYYPSIIEFGTKDGRIKPRYFLRHAAERGGNRALAVACTGIKTALELVRAT